MGSTAANRFFLLLVFTACRATPVVAATPAVLVDLDLKPHRAKVQSLADGLISYFDTQRRMRVEPVDQFVQVRQIGLRHDDAVTTRSAGASVQGQRGADAQGTVELVDGQRLTGQWVGAGASGNKLIWRHPLLGQVVLDLDQIRTVSPSDDLPRHRDSMLSSLDRVTLVNGDKLEGFVNAVCSTGLVFQPVGQDQSIVLPVDRLATILLANPPQGYGSERCVVWLNDGSRIASKSIDITSDQASIEPILSSDTPTQTVPLSQLVRIDLAVADGYLVDLVDLPMAVSAGGGVLGLPLPPRVEGTSVWMHAPVTVQYELPDQAWRFSATAVVASDGEPSAARAWADFEVEVADAAGETMSRDRLNRLRRTAVINTRLHGPKLIITLDAGHNGPVMDRMLLQDALVLVKRTPEANPPLRFVPDSTLD